MRASIRSIVARPLLLALLGGCTVGPAYHPPAAPAAPAYKELAGAGSDVDPQWKVAQPSDAAIRGNWWELFNDPQLNALEQQVNVSNQNIAASFAAFQQARALVKEARSQYYPTLSTSPSVTLGRQPVGTTGGRGVAATTGTTGRSEEHTSELQSHRPISYAVFCLKKKK